MLLLMVPVWAQDADSPVDTTVTTLQYNLLMDARGHEVTGLCIMNISADGSVVGTIINELGVKAFDFTRDHGRTRVLNVLGPLNKWYIRKVLRNDVTFILDHIREGREAQWKKRRIVFQPDGDIRVCNDRFRINYTFTPMKENETIE